MKRFFYIFIIPVITLLPYSCSLMPDELNTAERMMEQSPDSALLVLQNIQSIRLLSPANKAFYALLMSQALDKNNILVESDSLISIATKYYNQKEPEKAGTAWFYDSRCARNRDDAETQAISLLKAQEYAESTTNYKLRALIYSDKADMYQSQNEMDSCIKYNKKGLAAFQMAKDEYNSSLSSLSIGYAYMSISNTDSAEKYLFYSESLAFKLNDTILISTIYKAMGNLAIHQTDYKKAIHYYHLAPITRVDKYDNNKWYLLGQIFNKSNQLDSAKYYMQKIKSSEEFPDDYYKIWKSIYKKEGNFEKSLYFSEKITRLRDSVHNHSLKKSFAGMEKKYHFEHLSVQNKNLVIQNNQRGIFVLVALLMISLGVILFMGWNFKNKKEQLRIQEELNEKKKKLIETVTENNELLQRQTRMQYILLQNVEHYRKQSVKGNFVSKAELKSTNPPVTQMQEEIIIHVDAIYNNISKRLMESFPELSPREVLICCMLIANFDTGMIATILDVKLESINIYRSRLRKKMQLENSVNLIDYLLSF